MSKYEEIKPAAIHALKQGKSVEEVSQSHGVPIQLIADWEKESKKDGAVVELTSANLIPRFELYLKDEDGIPTEDKCKQIRRHIVETARRNVITAANSQGDKLTAEALAIQAKGLIELNKLIESIENNSGGNKAAATDFFALEDSDENKQE